MRVISLASLMVGAVVFHAGLALGSVHFVSQDNVWNLAYSDPLFSDARIVGANTLGSTADAPGDVTNVGFGYYVVPLQNQFVTTMGGVTVDGVTNGPTNYFYFVHHPTGAPGSHTYHFTRPSPDGSLFTPVVSGGLTHLQVESGSGAIVEAGGPFTWTLTIPGDWSRHGTGPGQSEIVGIDGDWIVTQDFVFDGSQTTFAMHRSAGGSSGVAVSFNFYAVPGPGGLAVLGVGLLAAWRRR